MTEFGNDVELMLEYVVEGSANVNISEEAWDIGGTFQFTHGFSSLWTI